MLSPSQVKSLHVLKSHLGLDDPAYRKALKDACGVESSKDPRLGNREFGLIADAMRGAAEEKAKAGGWSPAQIRIFKRYAKLVYETLNEARSVIQTTAGVMSEEAPSLDERAFDAVMSAMEAELDAMASSGLAEIPKGMDIQYWRRKSASMTSRQRWLITTLLSEIVAKLGDGAPPDPSSWLTGFCRKATGLPLPNGWESLDTASAAKAVEALRLRKRQV
jgi:hypothetical protein